MTIRSAPSISINRLRQALLWAGRPQILFYALPYLMALLVAGTLAQRELGLYEAQRLFFSNWVVWLGPLPLPGTPLVLGAVFLSLSIKFLMASPWTRAHAGIILSHLGILLLLLGGIITALNARETFMVIAEGQSTALTASYHDRVLAIETPDGAVLATHDFTALAPGLTYPLADSGLFLTIDKTCRHCTAQIPADDKNRTGLAAKMDLIPAPLEKDDETNLAGVTFTLSGDDGQTFITLENVPVRPEITHEDKTYIVYVRRAQTTLPFSIRLKDFAQDMHPGTAMARAYHSDVVVEDNGVEWPVRIEMNEPLRYKGHTFYQSSFSQLPDGTEQTVLSVVRNAGRAFPYIATAIILAGLLLHLVIRLRKTGTGTNT